MQTHDHTMKRRNQSKHHRARVATLIFMFVKIYQIFSSNHISHKYFNNQ